MLDETSTPTSPARASARPIPRWRRALRRNLSVYLFVLPALLLFTIFVWYPIVAGIVMSFQRVTLIAPPQWVGLANFHTILSDPLFARAWGNTVQFTLLVLLLGTPIPLGLVILVHELRHSYGYFRLAFVLPMIIPPIVAVLLWKWVYDPGPGLANTLLRLLGLPPQPWLQLPRTALPALVIQAIWSSQGGALLLYLAALRSVPASLYDAAEIDGATVGQRLIHITLPHLRPIILTLTLLQVITSMQLFMTPFVMTDGGPAHATLSVLLLLYRYAFVAQDYGAANALVQLRVNKAIVSHRQDTKSPSLCVFVAWW